MENKNIELQIQAINDKLDFITKQLNEQQRRQREWQELKHDLTLIGKDVFQVAMDELDEVAQHFDASDLIYLLKKLLRNTRHLVKLMDQVESASDFVKDATPLSKQVFTHLLETLDEMDRKGYFEFAREIFNIIDTIVTSFTLEDVILLRENIATILLTVKNLTQPEMLATVNNALSFFQTMDVEIDKDISYWQLFKQARDPELKRGLAFIIQFMKNMVSSNGKKLEDLNEQRLQKKEE